LTNTTKHLTKNQQTPKMQNDEHKIVDLYIPRKCSWTNRLIPSSDRGAVQFRVAKVDNKGVAIKGEHQYISLSGFIRSKGDSDFAVNEIVKKSGLLQ
jgi:small subunit ribosomal protein S21e